MCDNINADRWAEYVKDAEVCYETDCTSSGSVIRAGMLKCILSSDHSACILRLHCCRKGESSGDSHLRAPQIMIDVLPRVTMSP